MIALLLTCIFLLTVGMGILTYLVYYLHTKIQGNRNSIEGQWRVTEKQGELEKVICDTLKNHDEMFKVHEENQQGLFDITCELSSVAEFHNKEIVSLAYAICLHHSFCPLCGEAVTDKNHLTNCSFFQTTT